MKELPPQYDPQITEEKIYKLWEESGFFNPDNLPPERYPLNAERFSIVMPPPNVTGSLHIGHALMLSIQDILIRFERMRGKKTLWLPGTDHAAIATQSKVESILYKDEKKTRYELGREEFLKRVEQFAKDNHDTIVNQIKRMGSSADWSREAYTLDDTRTLAVRAAFQKMHEMGLIYRGKRTVNWDPKMQTTVSDDEILWQDETSPLYYLKYGPFTIATARPETKFGDKYVVTHPDDERYAKYKHGQKIELEWINGPVTATVVKDSSIDMAFGTGAMTITPWHDATDFDIAARHNLDAEQIIGFDAKLLPIAGEFAGMHIKKARPLIVEKLKNKHLLEKVEESYSHRIATNSRGGGIIEPQIKEQWFIDINKEFTPPRSKIEGLAEGEKTTLKKLMRRAVETGQIKIIPDYLKKTYYHWIDNLRDWCISRQIWFGHRIPVWYCLACGHTKVNAQVKSRWFIVRHGETDWNKEKKGQGLTDIPLNETGRTQIKETAKKLAAEKIDLVISSDLKRAAETGRIIAEESKAELILEPALRERSHGEAEGMFHVKAYEKYGDPYRYDFKYPEGETYRDVEERVWPVFEKHLKKHNHRNVVVVSHAGVLRMLIKRIKNLSPEASLIAPTIPNGMPVKIDILEQPCRICGSHFAEQDSDTLDTWFSSGLWTFSALGWPEQTNDLKTYHPTSVLETGYDILFFWVARMILMTTSILGEIPFKTVYLHGLIRDKDKQKMSKSKGNIVDPLGVIKLYGTDALRFALIFSTAAGNDIPLAEDKIKGMKHFANKLWNIARFVLTNYESGIMNKELGSGNFETIIRDSSFTMPASKTEADALILEKLEETIKNVTDNLENFRLHEAAQEIYQFIWHELADVYIEASKPQLKNEAQKKHTEEILWYALSTSLKLLHPFMPFVTEEIYQKMSEKTDTNKKLLMIEPWPR